MTVEDMIQDLRDAGVTNKEIGFECGVHPSTVSSWKNGRLTPRKPQLETIRRLRYRLNNPAQAMSTVEAESKPFPRLAPTVTERVVHMVRSLVDAGMSVEISPNGKIFVHGVLQPVSEENQ